ncbi:competence protein ComA [Sulfolobus acidocaldarius SUSAZ]|nr:competence protein ComA [Sulfolobus acidocaldarius SUSAZ]
MENWYAEIITIGNEILSGKTINTNASHIARRILSLGYVVRRITTVMDDIEEISLVFKEAINRKPKLIISTGGLGPTYDDKTSEGLALALGVSFEINKDAYEMIVEKYKKRGLPLTEERVKMAKMPAGATPVRNDEGIAPGIYILHKDIEILATPGVPREMENVLENFIRHHLKNRPNISYYENSFLLLGVMESTIAPYVKELVKKYNLYIKTHPRSKEMDKPELEVQVAGSSTDKEEIIRIVNECINELKQIGTRLGGRVQEIT